MTAGRDERPAFAQRAAELLVAALFIVIGAIVVYDSIRLGASWGEDGPQPGYFPFYVGVLICISGTVNLAYAALSKKLSGKAFVEYGQLKLVLSVLVPTIIYIVLMGGVGPLPGLGIYVTSAVFVALFMRLLGRYAWWKAAAVGVGMSVVFFLIFEIWFLVPLPKGPLESALGLG